MAKIDELVLSLKFDNSKFKSAAQDTLGMLDRLKSSLKIGGVQDAFKGSALGAEDLGKAVKNVDMSKLAGDVSAVRDKFSVLGVVGGTAIAKLTSSAMDLGGKLTSAITQPLVQGGINRAKNIEQARFMLQGLGADVAAVEKAAMNSVDGTAYGFDQAARAASQFYASGVTDMKAMEKALMGISGATAMTGANYEDISQIFTTVSGQGRVLSEQLNQFASRGLNVAATLAKHFNVSEGELRDMVSKNKVSFEDFYKAMSDAYGEHAKKAGETFEGAMANAKAPLSRIGADVAAVYLKQMTGLFNAIKPFLDVVHGALEPVIDFINKMQEARIGGITKMLNSLTAGLQKGGDKKPAILGWIGDLGESVAHLMEQVSKIGGAIGKAFSNQFLGQWKGLRAFVDGAAASILKFVKTIQISDRFLLNVTRIFDALFAAIRFGLQIFKSLAGSLLAIGDAVFRYLIPPISDFIGYIAAIIAALFRFVTGTKAVEGGIGGLTWVIVTIIKVIGKFLSAITWAIDKVIEFFGALAKGKIFAEDSFPSKAVKAFGNAVKSVGKVLGSLKAPAVESLKSAFELLKTVVVETGKTIGAFFGKLDFSWFTNLFSGFNKLNIGNPFKDFKIPSLDLSKATDSVRSFGESLRNSIKTGDIGSKITEPFKNAFDYLRGLNWSGVMDGFKNAFSNIGEFVGKAFTNVKDFVSNVDWSSLGSNIVDKLVAGLTAAKDFASKVGKFLVDAFKNAVDGVDFGSIWNGMKEFGSNVKDKISGMFDGVDEKVDNVKSKLETDLSTTANIELAVDSTEVEKPQTKNKFKQIADGIGEAFKGMSSMKFDAGKIRDAFGDSLGAGLASFSSTWGKFITSLTNMFNMITDPIGTAFGNAKKSITKGFGDLGKATLTAGDKFSNGLLDILSDKRLNEFAKTLSGLIGALGVLQMGQGIKAIGGAFESLGGFFDGLSDSIAGFADAAKMKARTDGIFKIAAAIGILAASLWVLSKIDIGGLAKGVIAITALLAVLFGFLFAMDKFKLTSTIGLQLLLISSSIGILVLSIMALSKLDLKSVAKGVANVAVTLIGLGVALGIFGKGVQQLRSGKLMAFAASMLVVAAAVYVLAAAAERLGALSIGQLITVGTSIAVFIGGLMLAANLVTPKALVGLAALGTTMLGVSASLLLISMAAEKLGAMDVGSLGRAGVAIAALMIALTAMTKFLKPQDAAEMMALGGTMLMVAGAVLILAIGAQRLASIPKDDLIVAAGAIAVLFMTISIMANALPTTKTASIMASVMSISVMLGVLVAALFLISTMDWQSLLKGIVGIGAVAASLFVVMLGLSKAVTAAESVKLNSLIPIILTLTVAFAAITAMAYVLNGVEWDALLKAASVMGIFFVALAAAAGLGALAAPLIGPILALLLGFSASLAILAVGLGFGAKLLAEAASKLVDAFDRFIDTIHKISDNRDAIIDGANVLKEIAATDKLNLAGFGLAIGSLLMGMKNTDRLEPFINSMKKLGENSDMIAKGVQTLKDMSQHGKLNLGWFGDSLGDLFDGMENVEKLEPFINSMKKLGENGDMIEKGVQTLKDMSKHGKMNLGWFGDSLGDFMDSMGGNVYNLDPFINAMKHMGENSDAVMKGVDTLKSLRGDWGWDEMEDFGKTFKKMSDNMDNGQNMWFLINPMKDLGNNADIIMKGVNTLKSFGSGGDEGLSSLSNFGNAFKGLSDNMDNGQNIWFLINPMKDLGANAEVISKGINTLKSFGGSEGDLTELSNFGHSFKSLSDNMDNGQNIWFLINPMKDLGENAEVISTGIRTLKSFGSGDTDFSGLSAFGNAFKSFSDLMDNGQNVWFLINPMKDLGENVDTVTAGINALKSFGSGETDFSGLSAFGNAFKSFSDLMDNGQNIWFLINPMKDLGNNVEAVTAGVNALKSFGGEGVDLSGLSNFGNAFKSLSDNMANAGNLDGFVNAMTSLSEKSESIKNGVESLRNLDVSGLSAKTQEIKSAFDNLGTTLGEGLKLPDVSGKISEFINSIGNAARAGHGEIKSAFFYAFGGSVDGINDQKPNVTNAAKSAMSDGAQGAKGAHGAFFSAGFYAGGGMVDGLEAQRGAIRAKATSIASEAAAAAKAALKVQSPSRVFMEIGRYTALGLAAGIERHAGVSTTASTDMASGVIGAATSALEIHSPSKVFTRVGKNVNEGMAKGIKDSAHKPKKEIGKTLDGVIKETHSKSKEAAKAGDTFADSLINGINNNPATRRLERLMKHSKALYATKIKEKKIKDAEEKERKEDEREQVYRDVRESRQAIADAKRDAADAKQAIKDSKHDRAKQKKEVAKNKKAAKKTKQDAHDIAKKNRQSARKVQDSERKYRDSQQKIRDAEKKYRRSLSKKERYEYQQYGSEAGVAFVDGVAVGLIDESDKLPTLHEIMRDVLYEELDKVKKEADDFMGIFDGIQDLRGAFGKLKDNTNELRRAFTRMTHATNPRSFLRNAGHVFDAVVNIGKEAVGLIGVLDKLKPFLPALLAGFEKMLPAITPAIAKFAPGLAAQLGGGLTKALPAIAGPAAAIVAAVVGIGYLIYDSGTEQVILKFFRSIVNGVAKLVSNLPTLIANFMKIMITGIKNIIVELPRMAANLIKGVLNGIIDLVRSLPDLIPDVIIALVNAFIEIVVSIPEVFIDLALSILEALFKAIFVVIPEFIKRIPEMFVRIGRAIVDGVKQGIVGGFRRIGDSIRSFGERVKNGFKRVFGIHSPSKVMAEMGGYLVEGLQQGIEGGEKKVTKATDSISDRIRKSVQDAIDSLDDDTAFRINLTPVVDLEEAKAGLNSLETSASLFASRTADAASSVRLDSGNVDPAAMGNVTNITYTQNNTSPKPLSTIEIYRQTERQLANMR